jgi:2-iminobutanoate/2-iminopropanoate deaminase
MTRTSVNPPGLAHPAPIPVGARVKGMVFSSALFGIDLQTGQIPPDASAQVSNLFKNMVVFLEHADCTLDDVGHVTVFLADETTRPLLNKEWVELFPDPDSRPARHVIVQNLPDPLHIQLELIAVGDPP